MAEIRTYAISASRLEAIPASGRVERKSANSGDARKALRRGSFAPQPTHRPPSELKEKSLRRAADFFTLALSIRSQDSGT